MSNKSIKYSDIIIISRGVYPKPTVVKEVSRTLSGGAARIYGILDNLVDELGEAGVDVSYFPDSAKRVLVKYAKLLAKRNV